MIQLLPVSQLESLLEIHLRMKPPRPPMYYFFILSNYFGKLRKMFESLFALLEMFSLT